MGKVSISFKIAGVKSQNYIKKIRTKSPFRFKIEVDMLKLFFTKQAKSHRLLAQCSLKGAQGASCMKLKK
jgi:hypothetical protein